MTLDVVTLLAELFPAEWGAVEPSRVALRRLSGALTNAVYDVEAAPDVDGQRGPRLLLRLYGFGSDDFINRANEMSWLAALAAHGYGPRLLGAFMNGRCEQFLASRTMRKDDLVRPDLMAAVARNFCQLHAVQSRSLEKPTASEMWGQMRSWTEVTVEAWRHVIPTRNPQAYDQLVQAQLPWDQLEAESEFLQAALEGISDCLVFCHNDLQYGNIIQLLVGHDADGSPQYGDVILVDYEYAGINYAPYDIANHFCEFAADYHSDTPYRMDYSRYPTLAQQSFFIRTY
ncbi:kinase-like protein, partial [Caulochytrium protostelioides]